MKIKRGITAILAAALLLNSTACTTTKEALPEDTIEAYEDACNAMDIQAMLDCMDEKSVKSITAGMDMIMGIAGAVAGVDLGISASDMIDLAPLMQAMLGESFAAQMGEVPQVDFQVKETYIKGERATVYFTEANSGQNMTVNMVKDGGKWYMTLSTITITKDSAERVIIAGEEGKKGKKKKGKLSDEEKSIVEDLLKGLEKDGDEDDEEEMAEEDSKDEEKSSDILSRLLGTDQLEKAIKDILESDDK